MSAIRRWFLLGGAILSIVLGFTLGIAFMMNVINIFNLAIEMGGNNAVSLVTNLAQSIKGILGWIVFGIVMTNALIIASSLSVVMMIGEKNQK